MRLADLPLGSLGLLDAAQIAQFSFFLQAADRVGCGPIEVDPFTFEWLSGHRPVANITRWTFPG